MKQLIEEALLTIVIVVAGYATLVVLFA